MKSKAATVAEYLKELPEEDRKVISAVRKVIRANLPKGMEERMNWGMINYQVPLSRYPKTYNGQPLAYASLAKQKNFYAVYLMGITPEFREAYRKTGKKLDAGVSCIRFKTLDDLPLDLIGKAVGSMTMDEYIARSENARSKR
jgi:uncharacterized protein YdhG (YjbR/CyaY superfamily)